jgi:Family of unknown function (DUF6370)
MSLAMDVLSESGIRRFQSVARRGASRLGPESYDAPTAGGNPQKPAATRAIFPDNLIVLAGSRWFNKLPPCGIVAPCLVRAWVQSCVMDFYSRRLAMRKLLALAAAGVLLLSGVAVLRAADDEKITIKGDGVCAKCALSEKDSCQNVIIVTKDGAKKKYYVVHDTVAKKAHGSIGFCRASEEKPAKVKATGTCKEEEGKLVFTAEKIEKDED